jgi:hypothetical protein
MSDEVHLKVTMTFICKNMCDKETFLEEFNNSAEELYKSISDDYSDHVFNFTDDAGEIIKIETIEILE